jgi:hypothetical protein
MAIRGYLDAVDPMQIRGWAYDPSRPDEVVVVRIMLDDQLIAEGSAVLFRDDLAKDGVGDGNRAFIFNLERSLTAAEISKISARARTADGSEALLPKAEAHDTIEPPTAALHRQIALLGACSDDSQQPVFILGAARSGTSAITQALLKLGIFEGHEEGHLLDLLAHFSVALNKFYELKYDEIAGDRDTAITRVPIEFMHEGLDRILIEAVRELFPTSRWIDKTPNSDMVHLATRFRKIWPRSRFIFMRRRFIENAASRSRKFPEHDFGRSAREWGNAMDGWLQIRSQLHGCAVEIDQKFLGEEPELVASRLRPFLSLSDTEEARFAQALRYDLPERTSASHRECHDIEEMGWDETERRCFSQYCERPMTAFGYSTTPSYYLSGFEADGFIYL